jgi:hypothetical protein
MSSAASVSIEGSFSFARADQDVTEVAMLFMVP